MLLSTFKEDTPVILLCKIIPSKVCSYMPGLVGDFLYGDGYSSHYANLEIYDTIYEKKAAKYKISMLNTIYL